MKKCLMGLALAALVAGCTTPTTRVDLRNDRGPQVAGLDYRDVQLAANQVLQSLYRSGRLDRGDGQMYVMSVDRVKNDTMQRFDTDIVTSYITQELMNKTIEGIKPSVNKELLKEYEEMRDKMEGINRSNALPRVGYV